jgi:hypothetical protein
MRQIESTGALGHCDEYHSVTVHLGLCMKSPGDFSPDGIHSGVPLPPRILN